MKIGKLLLLLSAFFFATALRAQPLIWDLQHLKAVKKAIRQGDATYTTALRQLTDAAEKELQKKPATVIDKPMMPPSGDKHDYMSLGRYWWPNPDTPDGLPYIRKDGHSNPELHKFDRGKLGGLGSSISRLALAYYFTGNAQYARKAEEMLDVWFLNPETRMNPNLNYGQTIPGHNEGKGRAEGIIDTYSLIPVVDAVLLLDREGEFSKSRMQALQEWFDAYSRWMVQSEIGQAERAAKNNHGLAYDVQLAVFAAFAGNDTLADSVLRNFAEKRLFRQIEPDGSQPLELARTTGFGYSVFNITHMLDMCDFARHRKFDLYGTTSSDGRSIAAAIDYLTPYLGKSVEEFPFQQIKNWETEQQALTRVLRRAARYEPSERYAELSRKYSRETPDDLFILLYL